MSTSNSDVKDNTSKIRELQVKSVKLPPLFIKLVNKHKETHCVYLRIFKNIQKYIKNFDNLIWIEWS